MGFPTPIRKEDGPYCPSLAKAVQSWEGLICEPFDPELDIEILRDSRMLIVLEHGEVETGNSGTVMILRPALLTRRLKHCKDAHRRRDSWRSNERTSHGAPVGESQSTGCFKEKYFWACRVVRLLHTEGHQEKDIG